MSDKKYGTGLTGWQEVIRDLNSERIPAAPVPASTGRELIEYRAGADDVWHSAPLSERESLVKDGFQVRATVAARELDVEAERGEDYENMGGEYTGPGKEGWYYWSDETAAAWDGWLKRAARSTAQGTHAESAKPRRNHD